MFKERRFGGVQFVRFAPETGHWARIGEKVR